MSKHGGHGGGVGVGPIFLRREAFETLSRDLNFTNAGAFQARVARRSKNKGPWEQAEALKERGCKPGVQMGKETL